MARLKIRIKETLSKRTKTNLKRNLDFLMSQSIVIKKEHDSSDDGDEAPKASDMNNANKSIMISDVHSIPVKKRKEYIEVDESDMKFDSQSHISILSSPVSPKISPKREDVDDPEQLAIDTNPYPVDDNTDTTATPTDNTPPHPDKDGSSTTTGEKSKIRVRKNLFIAIANVEENSRAPAAEKIDDNIMKPREAAEADSIKPREAVTNDEPEQEEGESEEEDEEPVELTNSRQGANGDGGDDEPSQPHGRRRAAQSYNGIMYNFIETVNFTEKNLYQLVPGTYIDRRDTEAIAQSIEAISSNPAMGSHFRSSHIVDAFVSLNKDSELSKFFRGTSSFNANIIRLGIIEDLIYTYVHDMGLFVPWTFRLIQTDVRMYPIFRKKFITWTEVISCIHSQVTLADNRFVNYGLPRVHVSFFHSLPPLPAMVANTKVILKCDKLDREMVSKSLLPRENESYTLGFLVPLLTLYFRQYCELVSEPEDSEVVSRPDFLASILPLKLLPLELTSYFSFYLVTPAQDQPTVNVNEFYKIRAACQTERRLQNQADEIVARRERLEVNLVWRNYCQHVAVKTTLMTPIRHTDESVNFFWSVQCDTWTHH